ncbi:Adenylate cyclase, class 3 [Chryseolinea serpens]|uniref:Adenylate cyclase, class 3 n=1 Tax=Chryseolinea serpens TaxID=947013 RepID=A0A1M5MJA6_9BACT|nr:adenylate/guanylate cyclase domain-containing protein [Chryseolinea serpens]SHG77316.1 Adenylate cyclase, class 3 [Chryseolinea serpens]
MKIYEEYVSAIADAMKADPKHRPISEQFSKGFTYEALNRRLPKNQLQPSLQVLASQFGVTPDFQQKLGMHPDFAHLKSSAGSTEKHYIVSMFVDIKGSTNMFRKYIPETVLVITNTIQRAAIHTCLVLGGYVHRLQGDGLFVYFGGKNMSIKEAVKRSLVFSSIFTYFVKTDIKRLFNEQDIDAVFTRIGIDLGYDEDVLWSLAGLGEISEVTTCSLHTSLASKMQAYAESNGIVVGDHIVKEAVAPPNFFQPVCQRTKSENDRYIFQIPDEQFNYTQHDFAWLLFLKAQSFIATDLSGNIQVKQKPIEPLNTASLASIASTNRPYFP